ncbi:unnamed protein product [Darwinula stevensoni]|uniref:Peptidase S1 domain-containing protein n=1 Tax=Darwinula stevensoni TaxID=69355 RepID=A0A7R9AD67_9CRUS|nr:unnamed protein product [Darwinula stevensoni]CAG0900478.1 unnamed protein product [Darwinula stevensoni]
MKSGRSSTSSMFSGDHDDVRTVDCSLDETNLAPLGVERLPGARDEKPRSGETERPDLQRAQYLHPKAAMFHATFQSKDPIGQFCVVPGPNTRAGGFPDIKGAATECPVFLVNPASSVTVSFGSADKTTGQTTTSTTIKYDTAFNTKNLENGHDIALVRLPTPLVFSPSIQPICFPTTDAVLGTTISACDQKAYGWGFIDSAGTIRTNFLQKLDVTVSSKVIPCSRRTDETIICGDSGGPLAVRYNDRAYVTGIASFVIKNCASGIAGYTRTSKYATWIQQQISG